MSQKQTLLIILGCAAVAALLWGLRGWWAASVLAVPALPEPAEASARQASRVISSPPPPAPAAVLPAARSGDAAPWRAQPAAPRSTAQAEAAEQAEQARRSEKLTAISQQLDALRQQGDPDPRKLSALLQQLEAANGSSTVSGVRLNVLRHNLDVVARMRPYLEELQALQDRLQTGKAPDAATSRKLQDKLAQLQVLQQQLRTDVLDDSAVRGRPGGAP